MSDRPFDMPPVGTWEERGGWVVRALMAEFGLKDFQAAGLVGNLGFESIGFTTLQEIRPTVPGSAGGYGWAQWTGPRRRAFEAWCQSKGADPASDWANYGFLVEELKTTHRSTLAALRQTVTLSSAVWSVGQAYERPGGTTPDNLPGFAGRLEWAERALKGARGAGEALPPATPAPEAPPVRPAPPEAISAANAPLGDLTMRRMIETFEAAARALQGALGEMGLYAGAIDGDWGGGSRMALLAFKRGRAPGAASAPSPADDDDSADALNRAERERIERETDE